MIIEGSCAISVMHVPDWCEWIYDNCKRSFTPEGRANSSRANSVGLIIGRGNYFLWFQKLATDSDRS